MGVMTLALSVFSIVPAAIAFANKTKLAQIVVHFINQQNQTNTNGDDEESAALWGVVTKLAKGDTSKLPPADDRKVEYMAEVMYYFFIVCIILLAIYLICSILLIYGACKGNRCCLLPWIIAIFETAIGFYLWLCIISLFQILGSDEWRHGNGNSDWEMKPRFSTNYNSVPTHD